MIKLKDILLEIQGHDPITKLIGDVKRLELNLKVAFPALANLSIFLRGNKELYLNSIRMKPNEKGKGYGRKVMNEIIKFTDENGLYITLHPQPDKGYKEKLLKFYKLFGFYPNKGRRGLSQYGGAFGLYLIRPPKKKITLTEIRSPYEPAKSTDFRRGYIGFEYMGVVIGYDEMVPNVNQVDHSELGRLSWVNRFRYFIEKPKNTLVWNDDAYLPDKETQQKVISWLEKKGVKVDRQSYWTKEFGPNT